MADCKVTCFQRVMNLVLKLPEHKQREAVRIIQEDSFIDFLDFCVANDCFSQSQSDTLYDGIVMWEDLTGNYWEEDYDKLHELYDAVGITEDVFERFSENNPDVKEMTDAENNELKRQIEEMLRKSVSSDYVRTMLEAESESSSTSLLQDIADDVLETSGWYDEETYNEDDIRLAIGRVILSRIGIEV